MLALASALHRQWAERREAFGRQRYLDRRAVRDQQQQEIEAGIERFRRIYVNGEAA
ncbi:hypothetical protein [Agromyces sp. NPDC058064]|uniref:hypothetical protein n=1 Tax=Agromyces sp. NPDC058064 TaxID=3346322 RepID=UPI0036DD265A